MRESIEDPDAPPGTPARTVMRLWNAGSSDLLVRVLVSGPMFTILVLLGRYSLNRKAHFNLVANEKAPGFQRGIPA